VKMLARYRLLLPQLASAAGLAMAAATACYLAAGPSLNFSLGLLCFTAILIPPLALRAVDALTAWITVCTTALVLVLVNCLVMTHLNPGLLAAMRVGGVIGSFALLLAAAVRLLEALRVPAIPAAAACIVAGLAWIAAPLWACGDANPAEIQRLVSIHPLLAINAAMLNTGNWTEQPLTYQLTTLGQDVAYALPVSVLPCVTIQMATTALAVVFAMVAKQLAPSRSPA
jgi:hypothetical protein